MILPSSITFGIDELGEDIRAHVAKGDRLYVVWAWGGGAGDGQSADGKFIDIFPTRVKTVSVQPAIAGDAAPSLMTEWSITSTPAQYVPYPIA